MKAAITTAPRLKTAAARDGSHVASFPSELAPFRIVPVERCAQPHASGGLINWPDESPARFGSLILPSGFQGELKTLSQQIGAVDIYGERPASLRSHIYWSLKLVVSCSADYGFRLRRTRL